MHYNQSVCFLQCYKYVDDHLVRGNQGGRGRKPPKVISISASRLHFHCYAIKSNSADALVTQNGKTEGFYLFLLF